MLLKMTEIEPLFMQYWDTEPIQFDPVECRNIADFIKKAQKEFSLKLDSLSLCDITLHRYTGTKLRPHMKISELVIPSLTTMGIIHFSLDMLMKSSRKLINLKMETIEPH
jgi:hypothetical protein